MRTLIIPGQMPRTAVTLLLVLGMSSTACTSRDSLAPATQSSAARFAQTQPLGATQDVLGVTGEGALYGMYVPDNWNGTLVLWAHGYNSRSSPLTITYSHFEPIKAWLLAQGYAVALSSYSENGWAVFDGATRTHQLVGLFTAQFSKPARVYLIGRSMGSLVATKLAETYPSQYDGVLAYCGFLGGARMFGEHIMNTRLLFELYYPNVLPGDPFGPPPLAPAAMQALAGAAMLANPAGMYDIQAAMTAIKMALPAVPPVGQPLYESTLRNSTLNALGQLWGGYDEFTRRGHGVPFDNMDVDYVIPYVNDNILRYRGHPDALNFFERGYQPTGRLRIPMVVMDIMYDFTTPLFHKDRYQELVDAAGASNFLYRTAVLPEYDRHCPTTTPAGLAALTGAFQQLVTWVETGVHP